MTVDPNIVGLTTKGDSVLPNIGDGVLIDGTAHDNVIGGSQASVIPQNTFSGNDGYGVAIIGQSYDNQVLNSFVGLNVLGTAAEGNLQGGILVGGVSHDDTIGGANSTPSAPTASLISGNTGNGITLTPSTNNIQVIGNSIGFDRLGNPTLLNSGNAIVSTGSTNDTISRNLIACFAAGTRIATVRGQVTVEALRVGDRVRTRFGARWEPVIWIGHRHIDCRRHPDPHRVWPVRIAAGAFGPGMPSQDVFLSPNHAVFADDVLIPVKYLINHRTIEQITVNRVGYYHVELRRHDVVLAEGLPVESYLDTRNRANFANGGEVIRLFADFSTHTQDVAAIWDSQGCAPFVIHGSRIDAVRRRVNARAATMSRPQRREVVHAGLDQQFH